MNKSYYAIIPATVRYDKRLTPNAKLLYGEITALCNEKGFCWASNSYFAELYEVSNTSISKWISKLVECGYISTVINYKKNTKEIESRHIYLHEISIGIKQELNTPIEEKLNTPIEEKFKDNTKDFNITPPNNTEKYMGKNFNSVAFMCEFGFSETLVREYISIRKNKKHALTETPILKVISEIEKTKLDKNEVLKIIVEKSWSNFEASFLLKQSNTPQNTQKENQNYLDMDKDELNRYVQTNYPNAISYLMNISSLDNRKYFVTLLKNNNGAFDTVALNKFIYSDENI